jgi:hypothetical protein
MADLERALDFMATHARTIDRRRLEVLLDGADPGPALDALRGHRNADGGYGWALEPDQRSPSSQPVGALHALEMCDEAAPARTPLAAEVCDWLATVSLPDGGVPFSVAGAAGPGVAAVWADADTSTSSLHITSAICAAAQRVAAHDAAVAGHPWLHAATAFCRERIAALTAAPFAIELKYVLALLDALEDDDELARVGAFLPASGEVPVVGGASDERMRPLDFAPWPDRPVRGLIAADAIERDLERLAAEQESDGGWRQDWLAATPAAELEWRGWVTVRALAILRANGRI